MNDDYCVYDQWDKKIVYSGTYEKCSRYLDKNNVIGYNYSKLRLRSRSSTEELSASNGMVGGSNPSEITT